MVSYKRRLQRLASTYNAKARKLRVQGVVNWQQLATLGDTCSYCGDEVDPMAGSFDHRVPFDRGGDNWITNIVRVCVRCQRSKYTKLPSEHAAAQSLVVICALPGCGRAYTPRWAEYQNGRAKYCSLSHAGKAGVIERERRKHDQNQLQGPS